jgi:DnaJ domain
VSSTPDPAPDHYEVLGVPRDASAADIERARKKLAKLWHPDRNKHPDAAHHFDAVQKAAEVLRDPRRRGEYDRDFALQAAMSLPRDLRDRPPPDPMADPFHVPTAYPEPTYPVSPGTGPPGTGPPRTGPPRAGAAQTWPGEAGWRRRGGRTARKARSKRPLLWAGLAIVVIAAAIVMVFSRGQPGGTPAANGSSGGGTTGRPSGSGSPGAGAGGAGTGRLTLPQYSVGQDDFPVGDGHVLSIGGPTIALLGVNGQAVWRESASVSSLDGDTAVSGGPQRHGCAVASGDGGHQDDFIALSSGQQTVVPVRGDSFAWEADRVALPDGTIRNPCTGAVLGRAAPAGTFSSAECLIGSTVIGAGRSGQAAWRNGHKLWQIRTSNPVICDNAGTVVMLDASTTKISSLNTGNGHTRWAVRDPTCADGCITHAASVRLLRTSQALILTDAAEVVALARGNGRVLWQKTNACALVARDVPVPSVLLGSCTGLGAESAVATVANPSSGATLSTYPVSVSGCVQGSEWTANTHRLLVACPATSASSRTDQANSVAW